MIEKDSVFTGIVIGAIFPVIGYVLVEALYEVAMPDGVMRLRTLALLAICSVLLPFHIARKNRWNDTMRGIVFPTLLYVAFWLYEFGPSMF